MNSHHFILFQFQLWFLIFRAGVGYIRALLVGDIRVNFDFVFIRKSKFEPFYFNSSNWGLLDFSWFLSGQW